VVSQDHFQSSTQPFLMIFFFSFSAREVSLLLKSWDVLLFVCLFLFFKEKKKDDRIYWFNFFGFQ